jgi:hypothetical protein
MVSQVIQVFVADRTLVLPHAARLRGVSDVLGTILTVSDHTHESGFEHLDLDVAGLSGDFHLRWKLLPVTDGPPG